jgi:phage gp36-like protein
MAYSTRTDLENKFGVDNILKWSDIECNGSVDASRIALAITTADEDIDDRFRATRYSLPFSPVPRKVSEWSAVLAGIWLFDSRPEFRETDKVEAFAIIRENVDKEIDDYVSGKRIFKKDTGVDTAGTSPSAPSVVG